MKSEKKIDLDLDTLVELGDIASYNYKEFNTHPPSEVLIITFPSGRTLYINACSTPASHL